mgnify:CR=1 FL=1
MSRRKRRSPQQVIIALRQADALLNAGPSVGPVIQYLGISEATYHRWRNHYGGMKAEEARRLEQLEAENARLKKLLADAELDRAILKEAIDHLGKP